ncbi:MAG: hypothetical protein PHT69_02455 [Bacteroidales bacterium]|nr:hypothetical protein [Bacteroidales bacterium]
MTVFIPFFKILKINSKHSSDLPIERLDRRSKELKNHDTSEEEIEKYIVKTPNAIKGSYKSIIFGFKDEEEYEDNCPYDAVFNGTKEEYISTGFDFSKKARVNIITELSIKLGCKQDDIKYIIVQDSRVLLKGLNSYYIQGWENFV